MEKAIQKVEELSNLSIAHYDMRFVKPLDENILHEVGKKFQKIVTVEDGVVKGGFGSAVLEFMADNNYTVNIKRLGIPDNFIEHGSPEELYHMLKLDAEGIAEELNVMAANKL
ncbi:1-deoxy-D-xylulose-5-phosphate synthase [bioreactor metagenome]|uniref:1-deoxy-D-xylulose-5-phosphate synthase n=1 Tax=bioreactor metagenome TaxID=1076179 RepID=A0A645CKF8_9ZZZZ